MPRVPRQVLVYLFRRRADATVEFLLLKRTPEHGGFWQGVSGAPEWGESDEDGAAREVLEETGLAVGDGGLRPVGFRCELRWHREDPASWERVYGPGVESVPEEAYVTEVPTAWEPVLSPLEHVAWRWCTLGEALPLLRWENNRQALVAAHAFVAGRE